ncbi:MAG: sigma-70 family RNA polymerase sigma factor [Planctomycetaceae bacterium]
MTSQHSDISTSTSLVARIQALEPGAWHRFCDLYGPLIYGWARRAGLQDSDAADIGQEVFRTVAARVDSYSLSVPGATFSGWLWTITRHKIGDFQRRCFKRPQALGGSTANDRFQELPEQLSPDSSDFGSLHAAARVMHNALQVIRDEFEPLTWQAFWRTAVGEEVAADVATDLRMNAAAVRQARYRVMRRLRQELEGEQC